MTGLSDEDLEAIRKRLICGKYGYADCADLFEEVDHLRAHLQLADESIDMLFENIEHGEPDHRAWLKDALSEHFRAYRRAREGKG